MIGVAWDTGNRIDNRYVTDMIEIRATLSSFLISLGVQVT